jgi:hypothetical protein
MFFYVCEVIGLLLGILTYSCHSSSDLLCKQRFRPHCYIYIQNTKIFTYLDSCGHWGDWCPSGHHRLERQKSERTGEKTEGTLWGLSRETSSWRYASRAGCRGG